MSKKAMLAPQSRPLTAETVDVFSDAVYEYTLALGYERHSALRFRLSVEEALIRWMDSAGEGTRVTLETEGRKSAPTLILSAETPAPDDPYAKETDAAGDFAGSLLVETGTAPVFSYRGGRSILSIRLHKKHGQTALMLSAFASSIVVGILTSLFLPQSAIDFMLNSIVSPLASKFFAILGCVAGPMIFLAVAWGIIGVGDSTTMARIGKKLLLSFLLLSCVVGLLSVPIFPLLGLRISSSLKGTFDSSSLLGMILDIIPSNIVSPFADGNTLQIILMAFVTGIVLLGLGRQTAPVCRALGYANMVVQQMMKLVTSLLPFCIFLLVLQLIWTGNYKAAGSVWKVFAVCLPCYFLIAAVSTFLLCVRWKLKPKKLLKAALPIFLINITTASSSASLGLLMETAEKKYRIDNSVSGFGVPLGIVVFKPDSIVFFQAVAFYFAASTGVPCSFNWIVTALIVSTILAIAAPPVAGGSVVAFTMLFSQLGISADTLPIVLAINILMDFVVTSFNVYAQELSLIHFAAKNGMLDRTNLQ